MATIQKDWGDGSSDKLSINYSGNKNDTVQVSSDVNEYIDRELDIIIAATGVDSKIITVRQAGKREIFDDFLLSDGSTFNVLKQEYGLQ